MDEPTNEEELRGKDLESLEKALAEGDYYVVEDDGDY